MFGLDFTYFIAGLGFAARTLKQLERWTGKKNGSQLWNIHKMSRRSMILSM